MLSIVFGHDVNISENKRAAQIGRLFCLIFIRLRSLIVGASLQQGHIIHSLCREHLRLSSKIG